MERERTRRRSTSAHSRQQHQQQQRRSTTPGLGSSPEQNQNPFDSGSDSRPGTGNSNPNPFITPSGSRPTSDFDSALTNRPADHPAQRYFHSRRVKKGEVEKPWTKNVDPKEKWVTILPLMGIFFGFVISGILVWDGIRSVVRHNYCIVLEEDFSRGLDPAIWEKEVQLGGFGNGEFQMTTAGDTNVFISSTGNLIIRATPQDDTLLHNDNTIDLLALGTCTSTSFYNCVASTNTTTGNSSVVPPVLSGRITTRPSASIKYGRIEVTAKLPIGDWLWPAIWMMPLESTYGPWPQSGEIDLAESRGNNYTYPQGGNNIVSSALHWGPNAANDAFWRTNVKRPALHTTYAAGFNTFGLEWSDKYIFTYINSRLLQVLYTNFEKPLWERGNFPSQNANGTRISDPWGHTGRRNTPFDQKFFLILNVAVGGTNGWFEDNVNDKPWLDASPNAKKDFWLAKETWFPTWTQPEMEVQSVKMWQQCDGGELEEL